MKGQIQMFETIAVLVVFFFIVAFGLGFYFFIAKMGAEQAALRQQEAEAIENAQRLTTLPEFDCSQKGVQTERCVDAMKITGLGELLREEEARASYRTTFGFTRLVIRRIYPTPETWEVYDNPRPEDRGYTLTQLPIRVYEPLNGTHAFGVIEVYNYE